MYKNNNALKKNNFIERLCHFFNTKILNRVFKNCGYLLMHYFFVKRCLVLHIYIFKSGRVHFFVFARGTARGKGNVDCAREASKQQRKQQIVFYTELLLLPPWPRRHAGAVAMIQGSRHSRSRMDDGIQGWPWRKNRYEKKRPH